MNEVKERVIRVALDRAERTGAQCWRTMRKTVWSETSDRGGQIQKLKSER